jgi:hypothetical protein
MDQNWIYFDSCRCKLDCTYKILQDVVLDQRVGRPAIDGKVGITAGLPGPRESNGTGTGAWVPSLAANEVVAVLPVDGVRAARALLVVDCPTTCIPERIEAGLARANLREAFFALKQLSGIERKGQRASGNQGTEEKGGDEDHDV